MDSERPLFHEQEYVILTKQYQDIPAGSIGTIAMIYTTHPAYYRVDFGPSLPRGPIPENQLSRLSGLRQRKRG